jgi:hypothetical protein
MTPTDVLGVAPTLLPFAIVLILCAVMVHSVRNRIYEAFDRLDREEAERLAAIERELESLDEKPKRKNDDAIRLGDDGELIFPDHYHHIED